MAFNSKVDFQIFSAVLGFLLSLPLTIAGYFFISPSNRKLALYSFLLISIVISYKLIKNLKYLRADLLGLSLLLISSFLTSSSLKTISGISAGNGDLPYYAALGKLLASESKGFTGWVDNFDMRGDLFSGWGYGGSGGAANFAFSTLISGQGIAELYLPTFFSYLILIAGSFYYLLANTNFSVFQKIMISCVSTFNPFTLYLMSQGFAPMFISLIAVLAFVLLYDRLAINIFGDMRLALGLFSGFFLATLGIYIAYPIFGAPFVGIVFLFLGGRIFLSINKKIPSENSRQLFGAILGVILPFILWPQRLIEIISLLPLYTSGAPGWNFQITKPSSLLGISAIGDSWNVFELALATFFLIFSCFYMFKNHKSLNRLLVTFFCVALFITFVFAVRDGVTAYTAWKASYFFLPIASYYFFSHVVDQINRVAMKRLSMKEEIFQRLVFLVPFLILLVASVSAVKSVTDKSVPMHQAPTKEIVSLMSQTSISDQLVIALGPLEQLWSIYLTDRPINLLAQSTHVSSQRISLRRGDNLIIFKDQALNVNFCPSFKEWHFVSFVETTWFKLVRAKASMDFTCM